MPYVSGRWKTRALGALSSVNILAVIVATPVLIPLVMVQHAISDGGSALPSKMPSAKHVVSR